MRDNAADDRDTSDDLKPSGSLHSAQSLTPPFCNEERFELDTRFQVPDHQMWPDGGGRRVLSVAATRATLSAQIPSRTLCIGCTVALRSRFSPHIFNRTCSE